MNIPYHARFIVGEGVLPYVKVHVDFGSVLFGYGAIISRSMTCPSPVLSLSNTEACEVIERVPIAPRPFRYIHTPFSSLVHSA